METQGEPTKEELEAVRVHASAAVEAWENHKKENPDWAAVALVDLITAGLQNLRTYLEDAKETEISWDFPFVELHLSAPWVFPDSGGPEPFGVLGKSVSVPLGAKTLNLEELNRVIFNQREIDLLSHLTRGVVVLELDAKGEEGGALLPRELVEVLDRTTNTKTTANGVEGEEDAIRLRGLVEERFLRPFTFGDIEEAATLRALQNEGLPEKEEDVARWVEENTEPASPEEEKEFWESAEVLEELSPDVPPFELSGTLNSGEPFAAKVFAAAEPLKVNLERKTAVFAWSVGLVFTKGNPKTWTPEEVSEWWEGAFSFLREARSKVEKEETPSTSTRSETYTEPPSSSVPVVVPSSTLARSFSETRVRIGSPVSEFLTLPGLAKVKTVRTLENVRTLEELREAFVAGLLEGEGSLAFEKTSIREALLEERFTVKGEKTVKLTETGEETFQEWLIGKPYLERTKAGEVLKKRVPVKGNGSLSVAFSFAGLGETPLGFSTTLETKAAELIKQREDQEAGLFRGTETQKAELERKLRSLGSVAEAMKLAQKLQFEVSSQCRTKVFLPLEECFVLLECEKDPDRVERVRSALRTLRSFQYEIHSKGVKNFPRRMEGSFVLEFADGEFCFRGDVREEGFAVHVSDWCLLGLDVLKSAVLPKLSGAGGEPYSFHSQSRTKKKGGEVLQYHEDSNRAPEFVAAAKFSENQSRLRTFLIRNLTKNQDAAAKGRRVQRPAADPLAKEWRTYGGEFCPLLDESKTYVGALGHFNANAESGWKLISTKKNARGVLDQMGYAPANGEEFTREELGAYLKDAGRVVEEYFEGLAVLRLNGTWVSLQDARNLNHSDLLRGSWFFFLSSDYQELERVKLENHHAERFTKGETDRPVRVQRSTDPVGVEALGLRERFNVKKNAEGLTVRDLGEVFGISRTTVSNWLRAREEGGEPIPDHFRPLVLRWIETGERPTPEDLKKLRKA